jgi:hypothetical protein
MVLEWREREHEEVDVVVERDLGAQMALKICGLYKFWALKGMRAQVRLLQFLVDYWDPDSESFNLDGKPLRIEVEDIYFLMGLSRRGEVVNLKALGSWEWYEDRRVHRCSLYSRDREGRESTPHPSDKQSKPQDCCPRFDLDHRIDFIAPGIEATYVLLCRVFETHGV